MIWLCIPIGLFSTVMWMVVFLDSPSQYLRIHIESYPDWYWYLKILTDNHGIAEKPWVLDWVVSCKTGT